MISGPVLQQPGGDMTTPKGTRALAALTWAQFTAAIAAVGLGVYYDQLGKSPGMLVIVGLGILGGPAFWWAWRMAQGQAAPTPDCDHPDHGKGGDRS